MLSLPPAVRVFVCLEPTDMRKSFDGLAALAQSICQGDPFSGHFFVFGNRRHDRVKILFWDSDGFIVYVELHINDIMPSSGLCGVSMPIF